MKIFVIGGKAKCGKNTFGEYLREELKDYGYKPCVMHITGPLYEYARNYFDWNGDYDEKPREFLQKMGFEIIREKLGKKHFLLDRLYYQYCFVCLNALWSSYLLLRVPLPLA